MRTVALLLVSLALMACSGASVIPSPQPFSLQSTTLLANGDFEGKFYNYQDIGELSVAEGWIPWWDARSARPEYRDAAPYENRIASGEHATQWFNTYDKHTAGIYQRVEDIASSQQVKFSCWIQAFSSNSNNFTKSDGRYRMRIGIDPYGGTDPESGDIVWSDGGHSRQPYDAYEFVEVEAGTRSDRLTVFVWGQAEWKIHHNNAFVDDCELVYIGEPLPKPTPKPTPDPTPGQCPSIEEIREVIREELRDIEIDIK